MPVKHWSFAGLMLTYWCNARCSSCYLGCGPERSEEMPIELALRVWRSLMEASPHGCRVHLSGGEPMGNWGRLLELCSRARQEGLGPLEKVETNAYWALDEAVVRERLRALDAAGMGKLVISADPYHQQYVPIERCRLVFRVALEVLGGRRVQVRWRDWLSEGFDTPRLSRGERAELFARYARSGRDRLNGRAAAMLAPLLPQKPCLSFADNPCGEALLRSRHVHVDPGGRIMPGVCAGIMLGQAGTSSIADTWRRLNEDHARRPIVGTLAQMGPVGLLREAADGGFVPRSYAGKCHLCWDIRRHFALRGMHAGELGPAWVYDTQDACADSKNADGKALRDFLDR